EPRTASPTSRPWRSRPIRAPSTTPPGVVTALSIQRCSTPRSASAIDPAELEIDGIRDRFARCRARRCSLRKAAFARTLRLGKLRTQLGVWRDIRIPFEQGRYAAGHLLHPDVQRPDPI